MTQHPMTSRLVRIGGLGLIVVGFLLTTDPGKLPSVALIVPFVLLFGLLYMVLKETIALLRTSQDKVVGVRVRRPRVIATLLAAFPVLLLVLQSIGQLTAWDIITAGALFGLAYVYIVKSSVTFFQ